MINAGKYVYALAYLCDHEPLGELCLIQNPLRNMRVTYVQALPCP
jgi:hypothetical protein